MKERKDEKDEKTIATRKRSRSPSITIQLAKSPSPREKNARYEVSYNLF